MSSKAEEITETLRTEILRGQYRPGERLPSERDLAARFDANRGSVREAIKKLEQLGIADVQPGGVRIVAIEDATLEVLGYLIDLDELPRPSLIAQLFDVLAAMVGLSARSALSQADEDEKAEMLRLIDCAREAIDDQERYQLAWRDLGDKFIEINGNLVLRLVGNGLKTQFVGRLQNLGLHPRLDTSRDLELLASMDRAVRVGDAPAIGEAIAGHFGLLKEAVLAALNAESAEPRRQQHA